jgi:hypothetical protein
VTLELAACCPDYEERHVSLILFRGRLHRKAQDVADSFSIEAPSWLSASHATRLSRDARNSESVAGSLDGTLSHSRHSSARRADQRGDQQSGGDRHVRRPNRKSSNETKTEKYECYDEQTE